MSRENKSEWEDIARLVTWQNRQDEENRVLSSTHHQIEGTENRRDTLNMRKTQNEEWSWSFGGVPSVVPKTC